MTSLSVRNGMQALADRTAALKKEIEVSGVPHIRNGALLTMQGLTGSIAGDVFIVDGGLGMFIFTAGTGYTPSAGFVYASTGTPSGQWVNAAYVMTGGTPLRVGNVLCPVANAIVADSFTASAGTATITGTTAFQNTGLESFTVPAEPGDLITCTCMTQVTIAAAETAGAVQLAVNDGSSDTAITLSRVSFAPASTAGVKIPIACQARFVALVAADHKFKLQLGDTAGVVASVGGNITFHVQVIRP